MFSEKEVIDFYCWLVEEKFGMINTDGIVYTEYSDEIKNINHEEFRKGAKILLDEYQELQRMLKSITE